MEFDKRYKLQEVCVKTGLSPSVIRYYERQFKLLIPRGKGGHREFTAKDVNVLINLKEMKEKGISNNEIKHFLDNFDAEEVASSKDAIANEKSEQLEDYFKTIEDHISDVSTRISELSRFVNPEERDMLISENMKLKLEIKEKTYELVELKNRLKYESQKKKSFFTKILSMAHKK